MDTKNPPSGSGTGKEAPFGQGNPGGQESAAPGAIPPVTEEQCHRGVPEGGKWPLLGGESQPGGAGNKSRMK